MCEDGTHGLVRGYKVLFGQLFMVAELLAVEGNEGCFRLLPEPAAKLYEGLLGFDLAQFARERKLKEASRRGDHNVAL